MLTLLDDHSLGPMTQDPAPRPVDVPVTAQFPSLTVIDHQHVYPRKQLHERWLLALYPVVHRVTHDQLWPLNLLQDAELKLGIDVA
jgi:hypothetical protein